MDFCASCQSSHAWAWTAHANSILRTTCHSWPPAPDVADTVASCSQCSLEIKCRLECSDCLQCICLACVGVDQRRQSWYRHRDQHQSVKGFIFLLPPFNHVLPPTNHECECLTLTGCIFHCERCLNFAAMPFCFDVTRFISTASDMRARLIQFPFRNSHGNLGIFLCVNKSTRPNNVCPFP